MEITTTQPIVTYWAYPGLPVHSMQQVRRGLRKSLPNPEQIIRNLCELFEIDLTVFSSSSRERNISQVRFIAFHELYNRAQLTLKQVGKICGRDHSTVIYGLRTYNDLIMVDKNFKEMVYQYKSFTSN